VTSSETSENMRPAAIFDRDGVINIDHGYVGSTDRFELVEGAARALLLCREAGFLVFVATNQSGVARGYFSERDVQALHEHMKKLLEAEGAHIDDIRYCPHLPDASCEIYRKSCQCRKPGAGMILDLVECWSVDLSRSFLIGDKQRDMEAASNAGISGFLYQGGPLDVFVSQILGQQEQR
jgi:D-glycero-D-manno-heptose 1,7-bisphosphate phosphatase